MKLARVQNVLFLNASLLMWVCKFATVHFLNLKTQSVRYSIELLFKVQISSSNPTSNIILIDIYTLNIILAHLSQRLIGAELIVYPCPGVRRCPPYSNIFSPETAWPIKAKFYVEHPWERGTKFI